MKSGRIILIGLAIIILLVLLVFSLSFFHNQNRYMQEDVLLRLEEISEPNAVSFNMQIGEQIKNVKTLAGFLAESGDIGSERQMSLLRSAVKSNGLLRIAVTFPDGDFLTTDGKTGNAADELFFQKSMAGEFYISDPRPAVVDLTKTVILFTAPITQSDGTVAGTLTYSYLCDDIDKIFNLSFLSGSGQMFVVKSDGDLLIGHSPYLPEGGNILQYLRGHCTHQNHAAQDCAQISGGHGYFKVRMGEPAEDIYVNYHQLAYNDWYMFSIAPEAAATATINFATDNQRTFVAVILICAAVYLTALVFVYLQRRSNVDKLTGAPTFDNFKRVAKNKIKSHPNQRYVAVKLDIKNFKLINRMYNFSEGDRVIKNIAAALQETLSGMDATFARVGTDDFVLLLPFTNREDLAELREAFIARFRDLMGPSFTTMVEFPTGQYITTRQDAQKPDISEIFEKVNFAHRSAKQMDISTIIDYEENLEKEALFQKDIEDKMMDALLNEEFKLFLQPKVYVDTEKIGGAEALVRWLVNGRVIIYPTDFVPVFEKNGFIVKLDMYMFEKAVIKIKTILEAGHIPVPISVNFSRCHLNNERFVPTLCEIADKYDVPHKYLEVELTESVVVDHIAHVIDLLIKLHREDFTLSMDDFGSGYSSLALLKNLAVDVIKLDRDFFVHSSDPKRAKIVVSNIIRMAKELDIITVAEGVETKEQADMLKEIGCDMIQGYYYSKPLPADRFMAYEDEKPL